MATSGIVLTCVAAAVAICSSFVDAHPILPFGKILPHVRPIFPPLIPPIAPIIPPIAPIIPPFRPIMPVIPPVHPIPIFRRRLFPRRRIQRGFRYIPKSRPFVLETPSVEPRREEPVSINLIDGRDNNRDIIIVTIDDKRPQTREIIQPQIRRSTDDQNYGDISVDGNVYIGADAGVRSALASGASVENVVGSAIRNGLSNNDGLANEFDYPVPAGPAAAVVAGDAAVNTAITTV